MSINDGPINYGTNNPKASKEECFNGTLHTWREISKSRCITKYICESCRSTHVVDSSD
jgi:hypothetical protein